MSLRFGLVLDFAVPHETLDKRLAGFRKLVEVADRYGFDSVTMGEGHSTQPQWGHTPSAFLVLAALAPFTKMRIGTGVTLVPSWNPLKLAYDSTVLDQLSGGRFILGLGLGPRELGARFGTPSQKPGAYLDDMLGALRALWNGEAGYEGKTFSIEGGIGIAPIHPGGPPVWVGGSVQRSADRAAQWGDGYIGSTSQSIDQVAEMGERYRAALKARGKDASNPVVASNRLTLVAENEAEAREQAEIHVGEVLAFYARRGAQMPEDSRKGKTPADLFQAMDESRCLVGTPDQVIAAARRYEERGITDILARVCPHDMPIEQATRTVELLGKHVLPAFHPHPDPPPSTGRG
jgi:alkanesulfonate monooxygenase SsuD/methylene tetrahydromethanopterin reductase-like flavin-dependent oxidoreductase (luciferase family)